MQILNHRVVVDQPMSLAEFAKTMPVGPKIMAELLEEYAEQRMEPGQWADILKMREEES